MSYMTKKTFDRCAECAVVKLCDAFVIDGEWKHKDGVKPCEIELRGGSE